ncbi:MAG: antibiotic biosynthesis monooxygenase [Acidobacteriota bacterium]
MFVVLSKFTVENSNGMTDSVKRAYAARPHLVDQAPGFVRLDVISPIEGPDEIWLLTYWAAKSDFTIWFKAHHFQESHSKVPTGLKLVSGTNSIQYFHHIAE